jgi:hypothetical protein
MEPHKIVVREMKANGRVKVFDLFLKSVRLVNLRMDIRIVKFWRSIMLVEICARSEAPADVLFRADNVRRAVTTGTGRFGLVK